MNSLVTVGLAKLNLTLEKKCKENCKMGLSVKKVQTVKNKNVVKFEQMDQKSIKNIYCSKFHSNSSKIKPCKIDISLFLHYPNLE